MVFTDKIKFDQAMELNERQDIGQQVRHLSIQDIDSSYIMDVRTRLLKLFTISHLRTLELDFRYHQWSPNKNQQCREN